ncbi:MAG TPA: Mur ligase family protein [Allosphingosinicella sp.]|nr:Mur ligase family protein [Allosphingosinicella sp.]
MSASPRRIHFVGVAGSGISAIAAIAHARGYDVSGCDVKLESAYLADHLRTNGRMRTGHSKEHVVECDLVVVSRVLLQRGGRNPEVREAIAKHKAVSWQKFLADEIVQDGFLTCVAGTHGKTTTTALIGELLREGRFDPTVVVGGRVSSWDANYLLGTSNAFVVEADEYDDNFAPYRPTVLVWNNAEFEHPDSFSDSKDYLGAYERLIARVRYGGTLVANLDDSHVLEVVMRLFEQGHHLNLRGIGQNDCPQNFPADYYHQFRRESGGLRLDFPSRSLKIRTVLLGIHNCYNIAAAVVACAEIEGAIPRVERIQQFLGADRRIQVTASAGNVVLIDDYAHHPTELDATIKAVQERYVGFSLIVVLEIHLAARAKAFFERFDNILRAAETVYYMPVFDVDPIGSGFDARSLARASAHPDARSFDQGSIGEIVARARAGNTVIITCGAADSTRVNLAIAEALAPAGQEAG